MGGGRRTFWCVAFATGTACGGGYGDGAAPTDAGPEAEGGAAAVVDTPAVPGDPTRTCVPKPPPDWQGPLVLFEGTGSPVPEPPSCPTGYRTDAVFDGYASLVAPDAVCTCQCGRESGGTCEGILTNFTDKTCTDACVASPSQTIGTTCTPIKASCGGAKLTAKFTPGSCLPSTTAKPLPAKPVWMTRARVCAPVAATEAGCAADRVATPTTGLPFTTNTYCIAKTGEDECPAIYPRKRVYYAGFNDARDCECTCGTPQGGACTGSVTAADSTVDCTGAPTAVPADGACHVTQRAAAIFAPQITPSGSCTPQSKPKGSATPTTPTTICCTR